MDYMENGLNQKHMQKSKSTAENWDARHVINNEAVDSSSALSQTVGLDRFPAWTR